MNVAEPEQIRERENFYHNLAQFALPILAKKKSGSASTFFAGTKKKMGGQASRLSPGFYSILEIRYLTLVSEASRRSIAPRVRPLFSAKLKASIPQKAFSLEYDA